MKRAFIRTIWGTKITENIVSHRIDKTFREIDNIIKNPFNEEFITYVYGKENYNILTKKGLKCRLIQDDPIKFDISTENYQHKIDTYKYAMEEDGFDEITYLDWDCVPTKKIPSNYWEELGKREVFQAPLIRYRQFLQCCYWKTNNFHEIPNGGFVYLRGKEIYDKLEKISREIYENKKSGNKYSCRFNDEYSYAKFVDEIGGKNFTTDDSWRENYLNNFEPIFCRLRRKGAFTDTQTKIKDVCFLHYI